QTLDGWKPIASLSSSLLLCARAIAKQFVADRVAERLERRIDDVGRDADRRPAVAGAVGTFDHHAGHGLGAAREDTHLVVDEAKIGEERRVFAEILAQCGVERI